MKSIIQEASSIVKAVEKAWLNAGKPHEFTVKIFEHPEKNFIGMTTKPAKIGIFFKDESILKTGDRPRREAIKRKAPSGEKKHIPVTPHKKPEFETKTSLNAPLHDTQKVQKRIMWTDDMIHEANTWVKEALKSMEKSSITFTTDVNNYYLRFVFTQPLAVSEEKERDLFRSFSFLMLQALKRKFKRPLRGFKVVLTR
jgi:predicted RNA-binding protein Jag